MKGVQENVCYYFTNDDIKAQGYKMTSSRKEDSDETQPQPQNFCGPSMSPDSIPATLPL